MHASVLRYVIAVARSGSIRKASEELNVAGSALCRQIQKLEEELGVSLFERLPNGLRLTEAGAFTVAHAKSTLSEFDLLRDRLGQLKRMNTGQVSVAALDSLFASFLPQQFMKFHQLHPAVDFRVYGSVQSRIPAMVAEGECDVGITFNLPHPEGTEFIADIAMPLMALVAARHPLAGKSVVSLADCACCDLLLQVDTEPMRSLVERELSSLDCGRRVLVRSNNLMMLRPIVLAGLGVAFFSPLGMFEEIRHGQVVAVPTQCARFNELRLGLLVPRHRKLGRAAQALVEQLGEALLEIEAVLDAMLPAAPSRRLPCPLNGTEMGRGGSSREPAAGQAISEHRLRQIA